MKQLAPSGVSCVLLPCADGATWVVPLNSLAEVVIVAGPVTATLAWRGQVIPVHALAPVLPAKARAYAVLLGLAGLEAPYWAVPLAPQPLEYRVLVASDLLDQPVEHSGGVLAVARVDGRECRVPDMAELQLSLLRQS